MTTYDESILIDTIRDQQEIIMKLRQEIEWQRKVSRNNLKRSNHYRDRVEELELSVDLLEKEIRRG